MERNRIYRRFIEPLDGMTNEAVAAQVAPETSIVEISDPKGGSPRKAYEVDRITFTRLQKSKARAGYAFNIWEQEGNGKIRLIPPGVFRYIRPRKNISPFI